MFVAVEHTFFRHPKTLRLCSSAQHPEAGWYLICLWHWACEYAPDGFLNKYSPEEIETAVGWDKGTGLFYAALLSSEYVDRDTLQLHDWDDWQGKWLAKMDATRHRMRSLRERRMSRDANVREQFANGTRTVREPFVDVREPFALTGQDRTGQDKTEETECPKPEPSAAPQAVAPVQPKKRATEPAYSDAFCAFWNAYPRREAKGDAWKAWQAAQVPQERCLATIAWQAKSYDWTKERGKFVPLPATWIRARRWEDEPKGKQQSLPTTPVAKIWRDEARPMSAADIERLRADRERERQQSPPVGLGDFVSQLANAKTLEPAT